VRLPAHRRILVTVLLTAALAGCGGEGSATQCGLDGCTVTFPRDGTGAVSVLGVNAELLGVENGVARIEVAGQTVSLPVGEAVQVQGFTITAESVTDTEVVVRVTQ
jgi:hypothetical protein